MTLATESHGTGRFWGSGREVMCREWIDGGEELCELHLKQAAARYPQGWRSYPGDVCPHGMYTGGCGADLMCGACESGDE